MEGGGSPARGLPEGGGSTLRLARSRSLDARRAPLSEGRISALQRGRAAQRARSASKRARFDGGAVIGAAGRLAGRERARDVDNDAAQTRRLRALVGESGRGAVVPYERVLACLSAFYCARGELARAAAPDAGDLSARVRFAARMSDLSVKTVLRLVRQWEETGELPVEQPGVRGAAAEAYERWASLPDTARGAVEAHIRQMVTLNERPFAYTRKVLQDFLDDEYDVHLSLRVCGRLLARWGFEYGDYAREALGGSRPARMIAKQIHLVQLDAAIKRKDTLSTLTKRAPPRRLSWLRAR